MISAQPLGREYGETDSAVNDPRWLEVRDFYRGLELPRDWETLVVYGPFYARNPVVVFRESQGERRYFIGFYERRVEPGRGCSGLKLIKHVCIDEETAQTLYEHSMYKVTAVFLDQQVRKTEIQEAVNSLSRIRSDLNLMVRKIDGCGGLGEVASRISVLHDEVCSCAHQLRKEIGC